MTLEVERGVMINNMYYQGDGSQEQQKLSSTTKFSELALKETLELLRRIEFFSFWLPQGKD